MRASWSNTVSWAISFLLCATLDSRRAISLLWAVASSGSGGAMRAPYAELGEALAVG